MIATLHDSDFVNRMQPTKLTNSFSLGLLPKLDFTQTK
jgi:hypothetical protein